MHYTNVPRRPSLLDRMLRLFTDVRTGESGTALLLTLNIFLILTAYYVVKVVREALILAGEGAEVKSYSSAGQALLLLGLVPLYGVLANHMPRRRLINVVTLFFTVCLPVFFILSKLDVPIAIPFFLWVGIFNLMIVAQFWSFANDVYTEDEGKRLFPLVGFGASSGAVLGGFIAGQLIEPLGLDPLYFVAAGLLLVAVALTNIVDSRERRRTEAVLPDAMTSGMLPAATGQFRAATGEFKAIAESDAYQRESGTFKAIKPGQSLEDAEREEVRSTGGAFQLVFRNRYLLLIALLLMFLNWVNTTGEYILGSTIETAAATAVANGTAGGLTTEEFIGNFYADFFSVVNLAGMLLQLFVVSRVLKYLGVRVALMILPIIALGGYTVLAFFPILAAVRWAKTAENATDYSLHNTVRAVLFLPTTREEKYKAKQAIDSFFVRAGDLLSAGLVFVGTTWLALNTRQFAMVNMALVGVWLMIAVFIGLRYRRLAAAIES